MTGLSLALPGGAVWSDGLQILGQSITLAGVSVPAGSLAAPIDYANPDRMDVINPSTGAVLASLILKDNRTLPCRRLRMSSGGAVLAARQRQQGGGGRRAVGTLSQFATPSEWTTGPGWR